MWLVWLWWFICSYIAGVATVFVAAWWWLNQKDDIKPADAVTITKVQLPPLLVSELQTAEEVLQSGREAPYKQETCQSLNYLMQFFFQEKIHDASIIRWLSNVLTLEFRELLKHRALSKIVRNMQIRDLSLGNNFPVISSITPKQIVLNPETNFLDLVELSMDITYSGGFQLAIDATTKFSKTATIRVKILQLSGRGRLQFNRHPFTHWSFSFYEEPQSDFEVESSVLGRHIPRFRSVIVSQLRSVLRRRHTLPYYKLRSRPLVLPGPVAAAAIAAMIGGEAVLRPCRNGPVSAEGSCSVPPGRLEVEVVACTRLQHALLGSKVYCSVVLSDQPLVCAWDDSSSAVLAPADQSSGVDQFLVMEVLAKKLDGSPIGIILKTTEDDLQAVADVGAETAAGGAGVRVGDAVLAVNGVRVTSAQHATRLLALAPSKASSFKGSRSSSGTFMERGKSLSASNLRAGGGSGGSNALERTGTRTHTTVAIRIKRKVADAKKHVGSSSPTTASTDADAASLSSQSSTAQSLCSFVTSTATIVTSSSIAAALAADNTEPSAAPATPLDYDLASSSATNASPVSTLRECSCGGRHCLHASTTAAHPFLSDAGSGGSCPDVCSGPVDSPLLPLPCRSNISNSSFPCISDNSLPCTSYSSASCNSCVSSFSWTGTLANTLPTKINIIKPIGSCTHNTTEHSETFNTRRSSKDEYARNSFSQSSVNAGSDIAKDDSLALKDLSSDKDLSLISRGRVGSRVGGILDGLGGGLSSGWTGVMMKPATLCLRDKLSAPSLRRRRQIQSIVPAKKHLNPYKEFQHQSLQQLKNLSSSKKQCPKSEVTHPNPHPIHEEMTEKLKDSITAPQIEGKARRVLLKILKYDSDSKLSKADQDGGFFEHLKLKGIRSEAVCITESLHGGSLPNLDNRDLFQSKGSVANSCTSSAVEVMTQCTYDSESSLVKHSLEAPLTESNLDVIKSEFPHTCLPPSDEDVAHSKIDAICTPLPVTQLTTCSSLEASPSGMPSSCLLAHEIEAHFPPLAEHLSYQPASCGSHLTLSAATAASAADSPTQLLTSTEHDGEDSDCSSSSSSHGRARPDDADERTATENGLIADRLLLSTTEENVASCSYEHTVKQHEPGSSSTTAMQSEVFPAGYGSTSECVVAAADPQLTILAGASDVSLTPTTKLLRCNTASNNVMTAVPSKTATLKSVSSGKINNGPTKEKEAGDKNVRNPTSKNTATKPKSFLKIDLTSPVFGTSNPTFKKHLFEYHLEEEHKFLNINVWSNKIMVGEYGAAVGEVGGEGKQAQDSTRSRTTSSTTRSLPRLRRDGSGGSGGSERHKADAYQCCRAVCGQPPDTLMGWASIPLIALLPETTLNTQGHIVKVLPLRPPDPSCSHADALKLDAHKGFEPSLCYGDVTLSIRYKPSDRGNYKGGSGNAGGSDEESNSDNNGGGGGGALSEEESGDECEPGEQRQHRFQRTQFSSGTLCDFCKKKIWLKEACQCSICSVICHKKCAARCTREMVCEVQQQPADVQNSDSWSLGDVPTTLTSAAAPEIVMTSPVQLEDPVSPSTPPHTPQSHRRTLSSFLASMKTSSVATTDAIKRTGSASNLASLQTDVSDSARATSGGGGGGGGGEAVTPAAATATVLSFTGRAALASFGGAIKRTGSASNIASSAFHLAEEKSNKATKTSTTSSIAARAGKRTSGMITSLGKSGVMLFVDDKNLTRVDSTSTTSLLHLPTSSSSSSLSSKTSLSPSQFFRSSKRSSSSSRCDASTGSEKTAKDSSLSSRRQYKMQRPTAPPPLPPHKSHEPEAAPGHLSTATEADVMTNHPSSLTSRHTPQEEHVSRSLPPSPQHSPPRSRKNSSSTSSSPVLANPFASLLTDSDTCLQRTLAALERCAHQDENLLTLARQSAPALLAQVAPHHRKPRIVASLDRVQALADTETERRVQLSRLDRDACEAGDASTRVQLMQDIDECDARTQALALLTMFLFTALHLCQDQIEEAKAEAEHRTEADEATLPS